MSEENEQKNQAQSAEPQTVAPRQPSSSPATPAVSQTPSIQAASGENDHAVEEAVAPEVTDPALHEYREVEEGVQARVQTAEERMHGQQVVAGRENTDEG